MLRVIITAEFGNLQNRPVCVLQQTFCGTNPGVNDILHAGNAEGFAVQNLQMPFAEVQPGSHFTDPPSVLRIPVDVLAQVCQRMEVQRGFNWITAPGRFVQGEEQGMNQLVYVLPVFVLCKKMRPAQAAEQVVAVLRIRNGERNALYRQGSDVFLVRLKAKPIIFVQFTAGFIANLHTGRK